MSTAASKEKIAADPSRNLPNEVTLALGESVKGLRIAAEKSQVELAFDAELERSHISRIERGVGNPSLLTLATLCYCLKTTLPKLFEGIDATLPPTAEGGTLRRENQATHAKPPKGNRRSPLR